MVKKILICSKDESTRESLKLILSDFFELILVSEIKLAETMIIGTENLKLVILGLEENYGIWSQFIERVKGSFPSLSILVISGTKKIDMANEAVRLGASGYIVKPFKLDEVLAIVRRS